jgi:hypothetical protein
LESQDPSVEKSGKNRELPLVSEPNILVFFTALDLTWVEPKIEAKYSGRKRRPHLPNIPMVRAQLFKEIRQIPSYRRLAKVLAENGHAWAKLLGFTKAPHHDSFSAFRKRVGSWMYVTIFRKLGNTWKKFIAKLYRKTQQKRPGDDEYTAPCSVLAIDSSFVKAYSNGRRGEKPSDPQAAWGYVRDPETGEETKGFGWRVHTVLDVSSSCPVNFKVTPANCVDSKEFTKLVGAARHAGFEFKAICADAGYDTRTNTFVTILKYKAAPIIAYNRRRAPKGSKGHRYDSYLPIPRNSKLWKQLFRKRTAVERQFSQLKEQLGFNNLTLRGRKGATIHFALSLTVLVAINLIAHTTGNRELLRSVEPWRYM